MKDKFISSTELYFVIFFNFKITKSIFNIFILLFPISANNIIIFYLKKLIN